MELNEAIAELKETLKLHGVGMTPFTMALQTAIFHLETLQKVKEMGGVKKIVYTCDEVIKGNCVSTTCSGCGDVNIGAIKFAEGFNKALDLKDAELAGKLEGLEGVISEWLKTSEGKEHLIIKIQELILGKKEA